MPSIFLSHNQNDKPFVRRLTNDLTAKGIRVWIDEAEIKIGDSLIRKISSGIYDMDFLGAVLSPNSVQSRWVQEELEQALHIQISEAYVKVLPILLHDCKMPGFLLDKVYADFRDENNYQLTLEKLVERINQRYDHLKQSFPEGGLVQERIGDVLVKHGFNGLLQLVKMGEYVEELPIFITNQTVQSNLRLIALKVYIESGLQNDNMFKQVLEDFDQDIRDFMIMSIREHGYDIDEETLRKIIVDPTSSNDVILHTVKLARDLVISRKISSNILLEDKIVNNTYWLITLCAISGIIGADEPDSAERLSHFSGETYWVARKRIREYFENLHDQNKLNDGNREKAILLLRKFYQDGKSSGQIMRKTAAAIKKLSGGV
jgi:TIR domain.